MFDRRRVHVGFKVRRLNQAGVEEVESVTSGTHDDAPLAKHYFRGSPHAKAPGRQARIGNSDRFCPTLSAVLSVILENAVQPQMDANADNVQRAICLPSE